MWVKIKRRLNKDRRRIVKQKAIAGVEVVGAGAALTGGSILVEKMIESPPGPQGTGHDNIYTADSSPSFIKIESLSGEDDMSALEITGWVLFSIILILLSIPVVRAILRIMRTCRQSTENYTLDNSSLNKEPVEKYRVTYAPSLPEIVKDTHIPKDMEAAWKNMDNEPDSTEVPSHIAPTNEDIVSKNASAIESMKRNVQMFRTVT